MNRDCVSPEVAKELQDSGYANKCENMWVEYSLGGWKLLPVLDGYTVSVLSGDIIDSCSAPTATQLAEELPYIIQIRHDEYCHECETILKKDAPQWPILRMGKTTIDNFYVAYEGVHVHVSVNAKNLPDALGKMMIYLLDNKLI